MNPKIVFVILHYLAIAETVDCVNSILENVVYDNYQIIIVDNGSGIKEDTEKLQKLADDWTNIDVVTLENNLGFARGNNEGFLLAKKRCNADFIVLLNNDTEIKQSKFCDVIVDKYQGTGFAVLGPRIILKDGNVTSNPIKPGKYIPYRQRLAQWMVFIKYVLSYVNMDLLFEKKTEVKQSCVDDIPEMYRRDIMDYKLHGCCLIFSKDYIDRFDGLNPHTFLYMEEDILYIRLRDNMLHSLYTPDLWLYHKEDAATDMVVMKSGQKRRFIYKNHFKSYGVLLDELRAKDK